LDIEYRLVTDPKLFKKSEGVKLNYSEKRFGKELFVRSHSLLFEMNVYFQEVSYHDFYDFRGLFLTDSDSDLPFDPFAAAFFLITRYEELTDDVRDEHDRFLPSHSAAYKYGFLDDPVVDQWAYLLKRKFIEKYPLAHFPDRKFRFISTLDIDQAFAFKNREAFRIFGSFLKSLFQLEFNDLSRQMGAYFGSEKDPFDTFSYIEDLHQKYNVTPIIFILFGRYGKYDKNIPVSNSEFRELICYISQFAEIGLHPSYTSNFDFLLLKEEMKKLATVSNKWIKLNRQHFLKLKIPETYYNLIKLGITGDYTMGYARESGFRAGTCTPYKFFDLTRNEEMDITIHPFPIMDRSLQKYLQLSPNEAIHKIEKIVDNIKNVQGTFISAWHNDSLSNYREYRGWKNVYKKMFEIVFS